MRDYWRKVPTSNPVGLQGLVGAIQNVQEDDAR